jgi:4-hydroxy-tetrahydrodipicolinate synthase
MSNFHGVLAVLCTPFYPDETVDYNSLRRLADYVIEEGTHAIVCLGLASETNRLSEEEKHGIIQTIVAQVDGRVPVLSGLQAASTPEAVRMARWLEAADVAGLMVLPRPGPVDMAGVQQFYTAVAEAVDVPIMVQDCPQVVGYGLSANVIAQMADQCPNIQYVKLEAQPAWPLMEALKDQVGDRLKMLVGWGGIGFIEALERGAVGCMPGADAIGPMRQVYERYVAGDIDGARAIYAAILPVLTAKGGNLQSFIQSAKHLLVRAEAIDHATVRQPVTPIDDQSLRELDTWSRLTDKQLAKYAVPVAVSHE